MTDKLTRVRLLLERDSGLKYFRAENGTQALYEDILAILNESEPAGAGPQHITEPCEECGSPDCQNKSIIEARLREAETIKAFWDNMHPADRKVRFGGCLEEEIEDIKRALRGAAQPTPAEQADLSAILERERTKVAECVTAVKDALKSYDWLIDSRGSYEWNDDRWHDEFKNASETIAKAIEPMVKIAADLSNCPATHEAVQAARAPQPEGSKG